MSRIGVPVEGRDYVSRFKGLSGDEKSATRNDVMLSAALALRI